MCRGLIKGSGTDYRGVQIQSGERLGTISKINNCPGSYLEPESDNQARMEILRKSDMHGIELQFSIY